MNFRWLAFIRKYPLRQDRLTRLPLPRCEGPARNPLEQQYQWSFTAGAADTTAPTVTQTIPVDGDTLVSDFSMMYAVFSEPMDEATLNADNITSLIIPVLHQLPYSFRRVKMTFEFYITFPSTLQLITTIQ